MCTYTPLILRSWPVEKHISFIDSYGSICVLAEAEAGGGASHSCNELLNNNPTPLEAEHYPGLALT